MADNSEEKISNICVGDNVWTYNTNNNIKEVKEVDYVYKNLTSADELYEIELEDGSTINITGNHKVLLIDNKWVRVDELEENDDILDFDI